MSEPVTPIPSKGLFTEYREPPSTTETTSPTPDDRDNCDNNDDNNDDINDDNNDDINDDGNCRDYYEEDMMVEFLERRRELYARSKSLNPSSVRVSYSPLLGNSTNRHTETMGAARSRSSSSIPLSHRRRPRRSSGRLSNKLAASEEDSCDNYDNNNNTRRNTSDIATELWAWVLGVCRSLVLSRRYTLEETNSVATTAHRHYYHQGHHHIDKLTTIYYNNKAAIVKWILISLLMGLIMTVLPCCIIPRDGLPLRTASTPRYCSRFNLPWRTPVVVVVDTGEIGEGSLKEEERTEAGGGAARGRDEGSWRSSLRARWTQSRIPSALHFPARFFPTSRSPTNKDRHHYHQSPTNDALDITTPSRSSTEGSTTRYSDMMDLRTEYESLVQRITNLERSQSNRNVDFRLIQEQLRSGRWIEDKVLNVIRNELPQELVLAKDPITGKVQVPEKFWDAVREVLGSRDGHVASVVQEELKRVAEEEKGKWEEFLTENENKIRSLVSDTNNKLSQRTTVLSRHEFLYLVATESNAIWSSLESRVNSFVQRQLAQWVEHEADGGGTQGIVSRVEQQILTEMIDKAIERYHTRHRSLDHINAQPDYALYNSGGRIIPHLTTQTYHRYKPATILGRLFGLRNWVLPPSSSASNRLQTNKVIQPEMNPGDCWPIKGAWGQVGIQLAKRVVVTEIVIEHVDPRVTLHRGTAPREIEIWRLAAPTSSSCSSSTEAEAVAEAVAEGEARMKKGEDESGTPILATWHKFGSPFPGASLLTTITYRTFGGGSDIDGDGSNGKAERETETAQRFSIPLSKQNVPAYGVVVRVLSNWGHPEFTCLYRVRVHGRAV